MDYWDEVFEEQLQNYLKKLNNFSYVEGFDLIYDGLLNLRDNQQFIEMGRIPKTGYNKEGSKWKFEEDKIPFIKAAKDGLSNFPLLYLPPLTKVVQYNFFIALYSIIQVKNFLTFLFSYLMLVNRLKNSSEGSGISPGFSKPSTEYVKYAPISPRIMLL